jgi:type I site-specific restriction endonuclease
MNEADTCRTLVRPRLDAAGWDSPPHLYNEQTPFGSMTEFKQIIGRGTRVREDKGK